jgi:hypothetical protein
MDDLRLVGLKLIFLMASCRVAARLVEAGVMVERRGNLDAAAVLVELGTGLTWDFDTHHDQRSCASRWLTGHW